MLQGKASFLLHGPVLCVSGRCKRTRDRRAILAPYLDLPFLASLADSGHVFCVSCDKNCDNRKNVRRAGSLSSWFHLEKCGGRGWYRTNDPYDVNVVLYH